MKAKHLPMPTASEIAQYKADLERMRQKRRAQAEAEAEFNRVMRGRHINVGGHDGKVMYVKFSRPHGERMYRIPLPYRATARTWRFLSLAERLGADPAHIVGWQI